LKARSARAIAPRRWALSAGFALLALLMLSIPAPAAHGASVSITGAEEMVYDWSQEACFPVQIPDGSARAFRDSEGRIQLIISVADNTRMVGADFNSLVPDCTIIRSSPYDPFAGHYNNAQWIMATYTVNGNEIFALIHNEYHASDYPAQCPSGRSVDCQHASVSLVRSTDGGASYTNTPPPSQYVAGVPYRYTPDVGRHGVAAPSNIVAKDGFYYAMLLIARGTREQRPGACVMRTRDLADPTSWRAWDGAGFTVRFVNPYLEPSAQPSRHICHPVSFDQIGSIERSVTFNTYLNKFFVIGTETKFDPQRQVFVRGFYYSFSDDLIHWSDRQLLLEFPSPSCSPFFVAYPSVIDHTSTDRNFGDAGQTAYLYYTRFNLSNCQLGNDRDLVRVPVEFAP
jgi:hypothetical protein